MKNIIFYLVLIGFIFSDNFYNWNILNTKINNTKKITTINPKEKIDIEFEYIINDTTTNTHQLIIFFNNQIIDCINVKDFDYNKLYNGSFNSPSKPGNYVVTIYSLNEKDCISTHNLFKSSNNYKEIAFVKVSDNSTLIDDWVYNNQYNLKDNRNYKNGSLKSITRSYSKMSSNLSSSQLERSIGFSTGGAKDINNFRQNILNKNFPSVSDITYEGLFYDYYFDTSNNKYCDELFCPSYTYTSSLNPITNNQEYFLSVGLNSGIKESDFKRKKLNLVVVLDISGSMNTSFKNSDDKNTKMEIANESIVAMLEHLNNDDKFGMVLFNSQSHIAKPFSLIKETNIKSIQNHILEITPGGSTNMSAGINEGVKLFQNLDDIDHGEYENRIIFLTDAMPNQGITSQEGLFDIINENANNNIYSTVIGIGIDFNTELIDKIITVKGANYFSVHNSDDFKKRLDDEFEYMVTPLVFNLQLSLSSSTFEIDEVYGSPEANKSTGDIMKINTLFPSETTGGKTKGGIVLLKLNRKFSGDEKLILRVSYEDRNGEFHANESIINLKSEQINNYSTGIQKGILLTRYTNLLHNWITYDSNNNYDDEFYIPKGHRKNKYNSRYNSNELFVSSKYKNIFNNFSKYFKKEINKLEDYNLQKELEILEYLSTYRYSS